MRRRLRPAYSPEELKSIYSSTYDHTRWEDHKDRINKTIDFALRHAPAPSSIMDLSCGDAAIARGIQQGRDIPVVLGDFVPGNEFVGPIERTLLDIEDAGVETDMFILSETLEHLDNPDMVLRHIRECSNSLLLSTPCDETIPNPEHYWAWGAADVANMLFSANWEIRAFEFLEYPELDVRYQLWYAV